MKISKSDIAHMKRLTFISFTALLLFSCYKQEAYPEVQVYGHAGMGIDTGISIYHNNSLEAISLALALPTIDGVEVDVRMSIEGTLWLFHENKLEMTTDGEGCIFETSDEILASLHYRSLHREKLVKLEQVWPLLGSRQIILDLKHWNECIGGSVNLERFEDELRKIPEQYWDQITLDTANPYWLTSLAADFNVVFSALNYEQGLLQLAKVPDLKGLMMRNQDMSAAQIAALKSDGKICYLSEMRSSKKQRAALKKQPFAILADDPRGALVIRD